MGGRVSSMPLNFISSRKRREKEGLRSCVGAVSPLNRRRGGGGCFLRLEVGEEEGKRGRQACYYPYGPGPGQLEQQAKRLKHAPPGIC